MNLNLLEKFVPPDDPKKVGRWRWFIAIAVISLILNSVSGRGFLFTTGSYAYASDVADNGAKIDRLTVLSLAQTLRGLRADECRANGNKETIRATMEQFQQDYIDLQGERYPLLSCRDILET